MKQSVLFRIASDPVARVWSGVGDLVIPSDIVEPAQATYLGGGTLVSIPDIDQMINGTAARLSITVSGVSAETAALAAEEASTVKGAPCHVAFAYFDDDWQLMDVEWLAVFRCDSLTTANQQSENGHSRSITLSIGTDDTDRSRAPIALWTDADQRRRSTTDQFFDHVAGITSGTSRPFGPSS